MRPGCAGATLGRTVAVLAASLAAALLACGTRDIVARAAVESCDRTDEDGNGIVDDLDANGDGLCDCLHVGVIGFPGDEDANDLFRAWLHAKTVPTVLLGGQTLTAEVLSELDVLLVQDVRDGVAENTVGQAGTGLGIGRTFSDAEAAALQQWVDAGGGLVTLAGFTPRSGENTNVNRLLAPYGLSYGTEHILPGTPPVPVTGWDRTHPIASGVTQVGVDDGYAVLGAGVPVAWEPAQDGWNVGRAVTHGRGHVFAWGDEWISYDAEWSASSTFQAPLLWANAFRWVTRPGYCQIP